MGAFARVEAGTLHLIVEALTPDGSARWRREASQLIEGDANPEAAVRALGVKLGLEVKAQGGDHLVWDRD